MSYLLNFCTFFDVLFWLSLLRIKYLQLKKASYGCSNVNLRCIGDYWSWWWFL